MCLANGQSQDARWGLCRLLRPGQGAPALLWLGNHRGAWSSWLLFSTWPRHPPLPVALKCLPRAPCSGPPAHQGLLVLQTPASQTPQGRERAVLCLLSVTSCSPGCQIDFSYDYTRPHQPKTTPRKRASLGPLCGFSRTSASAMRGRRPAGPLSLNLALRSPSNLNRRPAWPITCGCQHPPVLGWGGAEGSLETQRLPRLLPPRQATPAPLAWKAPKEADTVTGVSHLTLCSLPKAHSVA